VLGVYVRVFCRRLSQQRQRQPHDPAAPYREGAIEAGKGGLQGAAYAPLTCNYLAKTICGGFSLLLAVL